MERRAALLAWAAWGGASATLPLLGMGLGSPEWTLLLVVPWALFLTGGAASLLLVPRLLDDERAWLRAAGEALPGAALLFALAESGDFLRSGTAWAVAMNLLIVVGVLALVVAAFARAPAGTRRRMAVWALAPLAVALAWRPAVFLWPFALQAAAFLALAGFRRSPYAWARALATGGGVLLGGLFLLWLVAGDHRRMALTLDTDAFVLLVLPLLAASALAAVVALLWWRDPGERWRPTSE